MQISVKRCEHSQQVEPDRERVLFKLLHFRMREIEILVNENHFDKAQQIYLPLLSA